MIKNNYLKQWCKIGLIIGMGITGIIASTIVCNASSMDEIQMNEIDQVYGLEFNLTLDEFKENYNDVRNDYFANTEFSSSWDEELKNEHIISLEDDVTSLPEYYNEPYSYELQDGYGGQVTDYNYVSRLMGDLIAQMTITVDDNDNIIGIRYVCANEKKELMEIDWTNFVLILKALNLDSDSIMDKLVENVDEIGVIIYYKDGVAIWNQNSDSGYPMLYIDAYTQELFEQNFTGFPDSIYE